MVIKIPRKIIPDSIERVESYFGHSNVLLISGPSGCGKTYLVMQFLSHFKDEDVCIFDGVNMSHRITLMNGDPQVLLPIIRNKKVIFIDSAQRIPGTENMIEVLQKINPNAKIIVSYSTREIEEYNQIRVYPIAISSLRRLYPSTPVSDLLDELMVYGSLPSVILQSDKISKKTTLDHITNTDILKDLFELENITNSKAIMDLLYYLALNINKSLSINNIAKHINTNPRTAKRYIDLLEKHYIVHEHKPLKSQISTELGTFSRYYFYDLGIRNCLIQNYAPLNMRGDIEELWVNFLIMERHKHQELHGRSHSKDFQSYFWELYSGIDMDLVEVDYDNNAVHAFCFGYRAKKKLNAKIPKVFTDNYQCVEYAVITPDNIESFA